MANKKKEVTKAPSGLKITRSGNKFTASWKIGDKDYGDGQYLQYLINDTGKDKWQPTADSKKKIGVKVTSKAISIDKDNFYPNKDKKGNNKPLLYEIGFRVKGNRKKYTTGSGKKKKTHSPVSSKWTEKRFTVNPPKKPTLTVELDEELTNVCKFSWSAPYASDDSYIFTDTQWQTILVKNNSETDGSKLSWKGSTFQEGTAGAESSKTITEDTAILYRDGNSYTRWFRVRARGPKGVSQDGSYGWVYKKHVYALPNKTNVTGTSAKETDEGGFQCIVDWKVGQSNGQKPIDKVTVQYTIVVPDENLTCPNGASWTDANISRDTSEGDAAVFSIDEQLGKDQCLFIRVNTQHDSNITYGKPKLSSVGFLKDPTGLSVQTDNVTHKATINATNVSDVEDSVLVVRYVPAEGDPIDVGVIPHGSSSVTVQCPNWDEQTAIGFEVYAMVGEAVKQTREDGVDSYAVTPKMRSQNTVSQGGAVPVAPQNVNVSRVDGKPDTVQVTWDWPWSEAGSAEISWSDHDDAWESTDEPESFLISNLHASKWNISGLETGKTWYVRVRLIAGNMSDSETVTYGPWSDISQGSIDLSSAPNKPVLILSDSIIPEDGSTTASWVYTTTDNTAQAYAEVAVIENGEYIPIAHALSAQHVTIDAISAGFTVGNIYNLACMVKSASGRNSEWSDVVSVAVAEPLECDIPVSSLVFESKETNPREFEGNPIEFDTELGENIRKLEIALEPTQLGEGTPSPSNVRPIIGTQKVKAVDVGKNLFDDRILAKYDCVKQEDGSWYIPNLNNLFDKVLWENTEGYTGQFAITLIRRSATTSSVGFRLKIRYTDNTTALIGASYNTEDFSTYTSVTNGNKVVKDIVGDYGSGNTNTYFYAQVEKGSEPTEYESYKLIEISQEFDVSLTPTVIDRIPYNFKATGDVRGDRESFELVGGTVAWNQLVQNGNFSTESNWSASNATKSISSGICTFTATAQNGNICTYNPSRIFPSTVNNHKYFALAEVKLTTATTDVVLRLNGGYREVKTASNTNWQTLATVYNLANSDNGYVQIIDKRTSGWDSVQVKTIMVIDLTQMFGTTIADYIYTLEQGQAGAGVAFFRKYFPKPYYPYDAGTIKSVEGVSAHKTVGFNAWDEEWRNGYFNQWGTFYSNASYMASKNYIPVVPNTTYNFHVGSKSAGRLCFYDLNKECITTQVYTSAATDFTFTTPNNCYFMQFDMAGAYGATYKNDICINISWDGERDGEYEPYEKHSYALDSDLVLRGIPKLDSNNNLYYDGDTYESGGSVSRRYRELEITSADGIATAKLRLPVRVNLNPQINGLDVTCIVCDKCIVNNSSESDTAFENQITCRGTYASAGSGAYMWFFFPLSIASTLEEANAWFATNKPHIVYELATPTTETAEPFESIQKVTPNYGTEEFVTTTNVPVGNNTQYLTREVYGGTVDLVTGVLTVDMVSVTLQGESYTTAKPLFSEVSLGTTLDGSVYIAYMPMNVAWNMKKDNIAMCDKYEFVDKPLQNMHIGQFDGRGSYFRFAIADQTLNTLAKWNNYLASNPMQLVYQLATPQTYQLTPHEVETLIGSNTVSTENGNMSIRIAESYEDGYFLTKMPLEATVTGIEEGGKISVVVERAEDYKLDRPNEDEFNGYAGETILQKINSNPVIFETEEMTGSLDDGAKYNLIATIQDGLGQKAEKVLPFTVKWEHQALEPSAEIVIDEEQLIAKIRPIAPQGADTTDVADIYRLSADKPELIYSGATFGEWYVDPYPALGDMGGHRIVLRTKNGDYITEANQIAMIDSPELGVNPIENEEELNIIDFDGRQIQFYFDTDYSNTWAKDFQETQYLGGSIQGDWNPAVSRSGTLSSQAITVLDQEMLKNVRRLAEHSGICHVRTADGSSYAADVQVSEDRVHDDREMLVNYSLSITRVDSQGFDGMTLESWESEYPDEEEEPEEE